MKNKKIRRINCTKIVCVDKKTNRKTSGIIFNSGKCAVGDDVWRMTNPADTCDYPFKIYQNSLEMEAKYNIEIPPETEFYEDGRKKHELS